MLCDAVIVTSTSALPPAGMVTLPDWLNVTVRSVGTGPVTVYVKVASMATEPAFEAVKVLVTLSLG
jgi:hypothetical protein